VTDDSEATVREIGHTADVGLDISAPTLAAAIAGAAAGMTRLISGKTDVPGEDTRFIEVAGQDPPLLLRNVLREILYLASVEGFIADRTDVEIDEGSGGTLHLEARCRLWGGRVTAALHTELKGVTLHGLSAEPLPSGTWKARVIFDV
jgi:SHS2 domain-containing protein